MNNKDDTKKNALAYDNWLEKKFETALKEDSNLENPQDYFVDLKGKQTIGLNDFCEQIADELALNYFSVSFNNEMRDSQFSHAGEKVLSENIQKKYRAKKKNNSWSRNILVIGAGASFDAFREIPLAAGAIGILKERLGIENFLNKEVENKYNIEKEYLEVLHSNLTKINLKKPDKQNPQNSNKGDLDFESYLSLFSQIIPIQTIRTELQKLYHYRHCPSLFYEIVAHLFKHRFIDVIINFNFDELLEQAIEEEMGKSDFNYIISDGHCLEIDEIMIDGRLKVPLYIKPHGTASHKSTLRFTKDQYFNLPHDIGRLLEDIVGGKVGEGRNELEAINLYVVGFGMASIEFNNILTKKLIKENKIEKSRIFYLTWKDKPNSNHWLIEELSKVKQEYDVDFKDNKQAFFIQEKLKQNVNINPEIHRFIKLALVDEYLEDDPRTPLGFVFEEIWKKIMLKFNETYLPRSISRHQIISELFYDKGNFVTDVNEFSVANNPLSEKRINYFKTEEYYRDRTLVELIIAIIKGKGVIEIRELMTERVGIYFDLFRREVNKYNSSPQNIHHNKRPANLYHLLKKYLKLGETKSFARILYNFEKLENEQGKNEIEILFNRLMTNEFGFSQSLRDKLQDNKPFRKRIESKFDRLWQSRTYEINPIFGDGNLLIFDNFNKDKILHTNLALRYAFLNTFQNLEAWDYLVMISERGSFFNRLFDEKHAPGFYKKVLESGKKIFMICSSLEMEKDEGINDKFKDVFVFHKKHPEIIPELPYWDHVHHMATFIRKVRDPFIAKKDQPLLFKPLKAPEEFHNYQFERSIYFKKPGLSTKINPIIFSNSYESRGDHRMQFDGFCAFWLKSEFFMNNNGGLLHIGSQMVMDEYKIIKTFLSRYPEIFEKPKV